MRRASAILAAAWAPLALAACEFDKRTIGPGSEQIVVHGVLNPGQYAQLILLERTLTGRVTVDDDISFDPRNPVVTGGGVPVSSALVIVYGPLGDSVVAREEPSAPGVYAFVNATDEPPDGRGALPIVPGSRYRLRIESPDGQVVTGATRIPDVRSIPPGAPFERFNRDRDSIFLFWEDVPGASRYALRIDTPRGPFLSFVDSLEYLVSGKLRNTFAEGFPSVFVPGFVQHLSIGAVDTNYFDYYRSANDPFTGSGLINRLEGGIGLFGSYVMMRNRLLTVEATVDQSPEGRYARTLGGSASVPVIMHLYIDAQVGGVLQVTGNHTLSSDFGQRGLIGTARGPDITIAFLRDQFIGDTLMVLDGRIDGPEIRGLIRATGERVVFTLRPTT